MSDAAAPVPTPAVEATPAAAAAAPAPDSASAAAPAAAAAAAADASASSSSGAAAADEEKVEEADSTAEYQPVVQLKPVDVQTGEEDDETLLKQSVAQTKAQAARGRIAASEANEAPVLHSLVALDFLPPELHVLSCLLALGSVF